MSIHYDDDDDDDDDDKSKMSIHATDVKATVGNGCCKSALQIVPSLAPLGKITMMILMMMMLMMMMMMMMMLIMMMMMI